MTAAVSSAPVPVDRRAVLFGGLLLAGAALPVLLRPRPSDERMPHDFLEQAIPRTIGDYRLSATGGLVLPTEEELGNSLYDQILTRVYVATAGPAIMLMIGLTQAQNSWRHVHRPEACYASVGFNIGPERLVEAPGGVPDQRAAYFSATRPEMAERILYWIRAGESFPENNWQLNKAIVTANLTGDRPTGVLLRLSVREQDAEGALSRLQAFHRTLMASLSPRARSGLLGTEA